MSTKLEAELDSFSGLWRHGYFEGDPLDPIAKSGYGQLGFISILHATYLRCIKPYINDRTVALEVGPGRGTWTRGMLQSKEVYALDALPESHNRFYEHLEHPRNVKYFQVKDFECTFLPDNYFTYMFSFGCLCHVSFEGIAKYAINLYPKLAAGSNCFWMIADYDKYNRAISNLNSLSYWNILMSKRRMYSLVRWVPKYLMGRRKPPLLNVNEDDEPRPGRWYNAGIDRTCSMLKEVGYTIVDPDVGTCLRDPIIQFLKT